MLLNCGVGEDSWESLGLQGDQSVNPEGNQSWIFIGRTDAEAETPILWPPDARNWLVSLVRKDPNAGKDWRQEKKGMTEDETVGWHHWLNGCEFEQASGDREGHGSPPAAVHEVSPRFRHNWETEQQQQSSQPCFQSHRKGLSHVWKQPVMLLSFKGEISWRFPKYDNKHIHLRHSQEQVVRANEYWLYIYLDICLHLCFLKK